MNSVLEQNPDYASCQLEADPFKFAQEFGSAVDTSLTDPNFSSQGFYFPADSVASSLYATDQSLHGLGLDWQTLDVLGMQSDTFNPSHFTSLQDASLTLPASREVDEMSHHPNVAAPFIDPYFDNFQSLDLDDATATMFPSNTQDTVPVASSSMRGRKAAINAYQCPQFAPMTYATPHQAMQTPYFDATFAAMGYGIQPGPYSSMSAAAVPMMNVNIQLPSDQTFTSNFSVRQPPAAHSSYNYFNTMAAMPVSQHNENSNFTGQRFYSEHSIQPSSSYIPAAFGSRGLPCGSDFLPRDSEDGVSGVPTSQQELQHSSVIRGRPSNSRRDRRLGDAPYPKSSPATPARPTTQRTETESKGVFECRWGGCGQQLINGSKATYQRHLAVHGVRTFGRNMIKCQWIDPESGEECGRLLQMQSILKHVCGRTHLGLMSKECPLCEQDQARGSNIHRHWLSCSFFINLAEEKQRRLWSEYSKKPFDWYIDQQETRGVLPSSSTA